MWRDAPGLSYDVLDQATETLLTDQESFDDLPTDRQLHALLDDAKDRGLL